MRVGRGAAAEEAQGFAGSDGVPCAGRDEDCIAGADGARLAVDFHFTAAAEDKIKLLGEPVIVALCRRACGDLSFGEALVFHGCVGAVENAPDGGAVFGRERFLVGEIEHGHVRDAA